MLVKVGNTQSKSGFTLIELVVVLVLLGVLAVYAMSKYINLAEDAQAASIEATFAAMKSGESLVKTAYLIKGSPGIAESSNVVVTIAGIPVRFKEGEIKNTENSDHVPASPTVPQNRSKNYTRLFFLFLNDAPGEIVRRDSSDTGWAMLGNNSDGRCAAGSPTRCWEYRSNGERVTRITYYTATGLFVKD
jgi:MSHA pilin protein MshA